MDINNTILSSKFLKEYNIIEHKIRHYKSKNPKASMDPKIIYEKTKDLDIIYNTIYHIYSNELLKNMLISTKDKILIDDNLQYSKILMDIRKILISENKCIRNNKTGIAALTHMSNIKNLGAILNSGYLKSTKTLQEEKIDYKGYTSGEWELGGQVNGVYMSIVHENLFGKKWKDTNINNRDYYVDNESYEIVFVFSTVLLEREDYYLNLADQNGYLTKHSFSPDNINKTKVLNYDGELGQPEIIFPDKVSLQWVQEIWIPTISKNVYDQIYNKVINIITTQCSKEIQDKFIPIIRPFQKTVPVQRYNKFCTSKNINIMKMSRPNYCNALYDNEYKDGKYPDYIEKNSIDIYRKIARNCGISQDIVNKSSIDKLRKLIFVEEIKRYKNPKLITPTIYSPPFD